MHRSSIQSFTFLWPHILHKQTTTSFLLLLLSHKDSHIWHNFSDCLFMKNGWSSFRFHHLTLRGYNPFLLTCMTFYKQRRRVYLSCIRQKTHTLSLLIDPAVSPLIVDIPFLYLKKLSLWIEGSVRLSGHDYFTVLNHFDLKI